MKYPKGCTHVAININDKNQGGILDNILGGKDTVEMNGARVQCSDVNVVDLHFHWPHALVIFNLKKDAEVEILPTSQVQEKSVKGPTDVLTEKDKNYEDREKKVREAMKNAPPDTGIKTD